MGIGASELTLAQLAALGTYSNVIFFNDPSDTDLIKTIVGSPRTILINLGQFLNIASGEIQGDAVAIDELTATQIAPGAIGGIELDATPSLFETATAVTQDETDGTSTLLAANSAGQGDRLVLVQAECTEAFTVTSFEWDVGSTANGDGLFDDIFAGVATLGLGETVVGAYLLPETEALTLTETEMTAGGGVGTIQFSIIAITLNITAGNIADAAITGVKLAATPSLFENPDTTFNQEHDTGAGTILAANSAGQGDRLVLVQAEVTEVFATTSWEWDVGSSSESDGLFNDIFGGVAALAVGETLVGAYLLPEAEALTVTETDMTGDTTGIIRFSILVLSDDATTTKWPGQIAQGLIDFNAEGTENCVVTIGAVTYTEEHVATDVTVGEWDNGGAAATSATNLAAGINGDTRNAGGPSYAAVASGTTVFVFALTPGTAGNVAVSADQAEPDVTDNLIGGLVAAVKQTVHIQHTVTAEEATQVLVQIPLPFDAVFWEWHVFDSTGGILAVEVTDRGTVTAASSPVPAYFQIATNGATHISSGDIIRLTVTN